MPTLGSIGSHLIYKNDSNNLRQFRCHPLQVGRGEKLVSVLIQLDQKQP